MARITKRYPKRKRKSVVYDGQGIKVPESHGYDPKPGDLAVGKMKRL